jgi:DNA-binding CsgD family transcriptional regulator
MEPPDTRVARWVDVVSELLSAPLARFPREVIAHELHQTFDIVGLSWNWRDRAGRFGVEMIPHIEDWLPPELEASFRTGDLLNGHPLIRWFAAVGDPAPQSVARVPLAISPREERAMFVDVLRAASSEEQLSIPYHLSGIEHRAFVLSRTAGDFTDEDLEVARRLRPLLSALDRQASIVCGNAPQDGGATAIARAAGLTGRELAVLCLLADGHTAQGIARRLSNSPRTVQKHLEHLYRKLGVTDRLLAVRVATDIGLLADARIPSRGVNRASSTGSPER